jgi:hypothetical protein
LPQFKVPILVSAEFLFSFPDLPPSQLRSFSKRQFHTFFVRQRSQPRMPHVRNM